jgi:hypothetical protein
MVLKSIKMPLAIDHRTLEVVNILAQVSLFNTKELKVCRLYHLVESF